MSEKWRLMKILQVVYVFMTVIAHCSSSQESDIQLAVSNGRIFAKLHCLDLTHGWFMENSAASILAQTQISKQTKCISIRHYVCAKSIFLATVGFGYLQHLDDDDSGQFISGFYKDAIFFKTYCLTDGGF